MIDPTAIQTPEYRGLLYVNLLRCSNLSQADTSPDDQRTFNNAFARMNGMKCVGEVLAEGVSASKTFYREDFRKILELRKKKRFDAIVVHDLSRFTRGGIGHGHDMEREFRKAGIKLISASDKLPKGQLGELIKSVLHFKNYLQAEGSAAACARGQYSGIESRRRPTTAITPYGLDRRYLDASGKPTLILRSIGGGVRVLLDPVTYKERGRLPAGRGKNIVRFLKQPKETSELIIGAEDRLKELRWMMKKHYLGEKWGEHRIAADLTHRRVPGPRGPRWSARTVRGILDNPIYAGKAVALRQTRAVYYKCSPQQPTAVSPDQEAAEREGRKHLPLEPRDVSEWLVRDEGQLIDILDDPEVRRAVAARAAKTLEGPKPKTPKKQRDRHWSSTYFLKNILHSRQEHLRMRGSTMGKKGKYTRYYVVATTKAYPLKESVLMKHIPAEPVEEAVRGVVQQIMADAADIAKKAEAHVGALRAELPDRAKLEELRGRLKAEQADRAKQLRLIYATAGEEPDEALQGLVQEHLDRLKELRAEVEELSHRVEDDAPDAATIAQSVEQQLLDLGADAGNLPFEQLHRLMGVLVSDLTVDLETHDIEFELAVPSWALRRADAIKEAVGVTGSTSERTPPDTNDDEDALKIDRFRCTKPCRKCCYECRRTAKAA